MTTYYNEIDPYAVQWLRNLIAAGLISPGEVDTRPIQDVCPVDVKRFTRAHFFAGIGGWDIALRLAAFPADRPVWTGSCPCQPFSAAGQGRGFADERHLWPYWFHLIRVARPDLVLGEQVASKDGLGWFDLVQADLEGEGYAVGSADLCAAGVGAPHIRQRLWFVADADSSRRSPRNGHLPPAGYGRTSPTSGGDGDGDGNGHANGTGLAIGQGERGDACAQQPAVVGADWWVVEPGMGRVANGVPARVGKLRAIGNAIVPQVAAEFVKAYLECQP